MNRSRTVITALALVPVLALGACSGDDPEPKLAPPPSSTAPSSPSTTAVSGPVAPTMPAAARGDDAAAAEAFVKFYWEMVSYAQVSGDLEGLEDLSAPKCKACIGGARYLRRVFAHDGTISGGDGTVTVRKSGFIGDGRKASVLVDFDLFNTRQRVDYPGTKRDQVVPAGTVKLRAILDPADDGWLMSYWGRR